MIPLPPCVLEAMRRAKGQFVVDPTEHTGLTFKIAFRYQGCGLDIDELLSAARVGLVKAALNYDRTRGARFSTCAYWYMRTEIKRAMEMESRHHKANFERSGCPSSLADRDELSDGEQGLLNPDMIPDHRGDETAPDPALQLREHGIDLDRLPERDALVLRMRFGLDGHPHLRLEDVGRELGVTKERARQLEIRALQRIRYMIGAPEPDRPHNHVVMRKRDEEEAPRRRGRPRKAVPA